MKHLSTLQLQNEDYPSPHLFGEIAECYDYPSLESTLLRSMAQDIGADTSVLMHFQKDDDGYRVGHNLAQGVANRVHSQYINKYHRTDPVIVNRASQQPVKTKLDAITDVYRLSDVCDQKKFIKSGYYNNFLKPGGIRHVLALAIRPQIQHNDLMVVVGFHRAIGSRDFGTNALRKAVSVAPVIGSTIARLTFKESLSRFQVLSENLQSILKDTGYIILDEALQIQEMSHKVTSEVFGDLPFLMHHISKGIRTMIRNGTQYMEFNCHLHGEDRSLLNENINFEIQRSQSSNGQSRFTVRLGFTHADMAIARCAEQFGWTLRESEIVIALSKGLSNSEISDNLSISIRTVENHLRSIYVKADVTSRTQLLRQLLIHTPPSHKV